jgi:hypothetical protein
LVSAQHPSTSSHAPQCPATLSARNPGQFLKTPI